VPGSRHADRNSGRGQRLAQYQADYGAGTRSQCHANADLLRPARHLLPFDLLFPGFTWLPKAATYAHFSDAESIH
jgi:hypothetical protein